MGNKYYSRLSEMNPGELADGLAIEAELDAISQGFSKLPTPHTGGQGFDGPVRVGDAVNTDEAVSLGQLNAAIGEAVLLPIATYGNLSAAAWETLPSNTYLLFGTGAQFSNTPYTLVAGSTYYLQVRHVIGGSGVAIYHDQLSLASTDDSANVDLRRLFVRTGATFASSVSGGWVGFTLKKAAITALESIAPAADRLVYYTGAATAALTALTPLARTLMSSATAMEMRETLDVSVMAIRNILINGDFSVAQLGLSLAAQPSGSYVTDMWRLHWIGAGLPTTTFRATTAARPPDGARSWLNIGGAAGNTASELEQRREARDSAVLCDQPAVVSAYIFNNTSSARTFGLHVATPDAADDWTKPTFKYSVTKSIPSGEWGRISGKFTGDASFANGLSVRINMGGGIAAGASVHVTGVKIEPGTVLTPFEAVDTPTEFAKCQRFYESVPYRLDVTGSGPSSYSSIFIKCTPKRTVPTLIRSGETLSNCAFHSFQMGSTMGVSLLFTPGSSGAGSVTGTITFDSRQ